MSLPPTAAESARLAELRKLLDKLDHAFGSQKGWVDSQLRLWDRALADWSIRDIALAVEAWIDDESEERRRPRPGPFKAFLRKRASRTTVADGCGRCWNGFREVARHVQAKDGVEVQVVRARCTCPRGAPRGSPVLTFEEVVAQWRNSPSTLAVYLDPSTAQLVTEEERRRLKAQPKSAAQLAFSEGPKAMVASAANPRNHERWARERERRIERDVERDVGEVEPANEVVW